MAGDLEGFDASKVETEVRQAPIPAGSYVVAITETQMTRNKSNTGNVLKLTLQVLEGEHKNRKLFDTLNTSNPSEVAQRIGQGTLSAICRAIDVLTPKNSSELCMKRLMAKVKIENDPQYGMQNKINGYGPCTGGTPTTTTSTGVPQLASNKPTPW